MSDRRIVALLGRRDAPTDAVEEYCQYLAGGLRAHGTEMEIARIPWNENGWPEALRELRRRANSWTSQWVLVQYTALAWSARGFPLRFLSVVKALRSAGARVGIVFHDVEPYGGRRVVDRLRRRSQLRTMQRALEIADLGIFTVPVNVVSWVVSWLKKSPSKVHFIPIGANVPVGSSSPKKSATHEDGPPRVVVFGITGGDAGKKECRQIFDAMTFAARKLGRLKLQAFGRNANEFESLLREGLKGVSVEACIDGVLPAERVVAALSIADVMLFVREPISSRRGSAIAGISCGLPVIAYAGKHTAAPVTDAGVVLVSGERSEELGEALVRVLSDPDYRGMLADRSRAAHREHFAWDVIAARFVATLGLTN